MKDEQMRGLLKDYATAQHTRELFFRAYPQDEHTAGNDNVYTSGIGAVRFGITSKTASHELNLMGRFPPDYVDGSDLTIIMSILILGDTDDDVIDYSIVVQHWSSGDASLTQETASNATWTQDHDVHIVRTLDLDASEAVAGDWFRVQVNLEDDDNNEIIQVWGIKLITTVNERD